MSAGSGKIRSADVPQAEVPQMASKDTGGQKQTGRTDRETEEVEASSTSDVQERHEKLSDDVDSILDEIDEVLEENAEEFVRSYVQKGGE
jgi:ubiquitin-like protein Pup